MDIASIIGMAVCLLMVVFGIVYSSAGINFGAMINFLDAQSAIITFGGAFCAIMMSNTMPDFIGGLKSLLLIFKPPKLNAPDIIKKIIDLSNVARKEGLLSLEEAASDIDDAFLKKGILLIVDGTDPELVRGIMETELSSIDSRHKKKIKFWQDVGSMGPAWGMIGTLIDSFRYRQVKTPVSSRRNLRASLHPRTAEHLMMKAAREQEPDKEEMIKWQRNKRKN